LVQRQLGHILEPSFLGDMGRPLVQLGACILERMERPLELHILGHKLGQPSLGVGRKMDRTGQLGRTALVGRTVEHTGQLGRKMGQPSLGPAFRMMDHTEKLGHTEQVERTVEHTGQLGHKLEQPLGLGPHKMGRTGQLGHTVQVEHMLERTWRLEHMMGQPFVGHILGHMVGQQQLHILAGT